jgi:shikimate kinase
VIVEAAGRSIPEIFASEGEAGFRRMELETLKEILSTSEPRQCAPLAPSHFVGPSPYAGVRKCQFRTSALTPIEYLDCHPEASSCHPERSEGSINLVLALGGGTVMTPECAEIVKEQTFCIYLKASIETLMEHLSGEADGRPMLNGDTLHERITELMAQRSETYEKTAHAIIDTDGKSIEAIASEILFRQQ